MNKMYIEFSKRRIKGEEKSDKQCHLNILFNIKGELKVSIKQFLDILGYNKF